MKLKLVMSGGQTGADRAGLDFARENGILHAGFCPAGRRAEDGPIPLNYRLLELDTDDYATRTELNILCSDATVLVYAQPLNGGSALTLSLCSSLNRPCLEIPFGTSSIEAAEALRKFIWSRNVRVLNVAGNRESKCPGIYAFTFSMLDRAHASDQPA